MVECGCVISHTSSGGSVRFCGAHSYGMEMLPVLRRFLQIFGELETQYGPNLTAAYRDTLHEARAVLRKVEESQAEQRGASGMPAVADIQTVIDFPQRHPTVARRQRARTKKLA